MTADMDEEYATALANCPHWVGPGEPCIPPCWTEAES